MFINREWAMPCKNTFSIKPISALLDRHLTPGLVSVDPFANTNRRATMCNDLDPQYGTEYCMDALDFLNGIQSGTVDVVLFDPPYSPRQISECYKSLDLTVNMQTTQASFWSNLKKEISRITKRGGKVITFGWNSGGIGKGLGFNIHEILMVAHGGWHNDTICTVDIKEGGMYGDC